MLTNSSVFQTYKRITEQPMQGVFVELSAELLLPDGRVIDFRSVEGLNTQANYSTSIGHYLTLTAKMGPVEFKTWVSPNKESLRIRLKRSLKSDSGQVIPAAPVFDHIYDALPLMTPDLDLLSKSRANDDNQLEWEAGGMVDIPFQLIDPVLNKTMKTKTKGTVPNCTMMDLMRSELSLGLTDNIPLATLQSPSYRGLRGVSVVKPHNQKTYEQIILKAGLKLGKLASYLQEHYGLYSTGFGQYYQDQFWYVFPLYEIQRFKEVKKRLTIILIPEDEAAGLERSFIKEGNELIILCTGKKDSIDKTESISHNVGDGIEFNRASDMDSMFTHAANRATSRSSETKRALSVNRKQNDTQNLRHVEGNFTDNYFKELSAHAMLNGQQLSLTWDNSFSPWLYPAMPVKILYKKQKEIQELTGTLLGHVTTTAKSSGKMADTTYYSSSKLIVHAAKTNTVQA